MNVLKYKDYWTVIEYSVEDKCLFGKIEAIDDLVSFGCENANEIEKVFHEAVDEYIADCARHGKEPDKAYKGHFNVRTTPEIHKWLVKGADAHNISLNQRVNEVFEHCMAEELALA